MPTSPSQFPSNRHSARPEPKKRCALNALRHGLTGQVNIMTEEDRAAFDSFSRRMLESLAPEGEFELQLATRIARDTWRLNRAAALEDNLFALGHDANVDRIATGNPEIDAAFAAAQTFTTHAQRFQLLSLYEQRLQRGLQKSFTLLRQLQAERKALRADALAEAELLLQVNAVNGLPYEPAKETKNGFVFSNAEIVAAIDRRHRLQQAHEYVRAAQTATPPPVVRPPRTRTAS